MVRLYHKIEQFVSKITKNKYHVTYIYKLEKFSAYIVFVLFLESSKIIDSIYIISSHSLK